MSKNIFVGNLSFQTTSDELRELFSEYGNVTRAQIATDRETGRSRGFGFVEMSTDDDATRAVSELDGSDCGGRKLTVSTAHERPAGGGGRPR